MTRTLTVGTWNIKRLGYVQDQGHARLSDALDWLLAQTPVPPDILALPEATYCLREGQRVLRRELVAPLSRELGAGGHYEPFVTVRPGHKNHPLLLVNTAVVKPLEWHDPQAEDTRVSYQGFLVADMHGHEVAICCEHWQGGLGRGEFDRAANRVAGWGRGATLLLGDFNATSGWDREHLPDDWYDLCKQRNQLHKLEQKGYWNPFTERWEIDTRQLDKLRNHYGYSDMGEAANDPTVTTHHDADGYGLRTDRILAGAAFPGTADSYHVKQSKLSDHKYVFGSYRLPTA